MTTFDLPSPARYLIAAELKPLQGKKFQPTGFPDVGAGVFKTPSNQEFLAVESHQSVANRLESAIWDDATQDLIAPAKGLSYVKIVDENNAFLTASVLEAHRLNSVYVEKSTLGENSFSEVLTNEIGFEANRPFSRDKLVKVLAKYDVSCLLHGVFLESIAGVLRIPRALSGFIEAENIQRVQTGGVKNDRVQANKDEGAEQTASTGFGNVPFHRTDFVAEGIFAYFNLDLDQMRSYRLGKDVESLLFALSVVKIQRFLARGLRLRTACDLESVGVTVRGGGQLPSGDDAEKALPDLIEKVAKAGVFASPAITTTTFPVGPAKAAKKKAKKG
jgi:CRISPR-associated protein Csb1